MQNYNRMITNGALGEELATSKKPLFNLCYNLGIYIKPIDNFKHKLIEETMLLDRLKREIRDF